MFTLFYFISTLFYVNFIFALTLNSLLIFPLILLSTSAAHLSTSSQPYTIHRQHQLFCLTSLSTFLSPLSLYPLVTLASHSLTFIAGISFISILCTQFIYFTIRSLLLVCFIVSICRTITSHILQLIISTSHLEPFTFHSPLFPVYVCICLTPSTATSVILHPIPYNTHPNTCTSFLTFTWPPHS